MNTYYITANASYRCEYEVEAATEDEAIRVVEYGDAEPVSTEFDGEVENIEVVDVEYGETEYSGKLGVTFVVRGKLEEQKAVDALYSLLMQFDGKTTDYGDAELELVGFSVEHVEEA